MGCLAAYVHVGSGIFQPKSVFSRLRRGSGPEAKLLQLTHLFDIGANLGLFAFAAASQAGPTGDVIAIEPDPFFVHLMVRSCRLQRGPWAVPPGQSQVTSKEMS